MDDPKQVQPPIQMNEARLRQELARFYESDEESRIVSLDGLDLSLVRIKMSLAPKKPTTVQVVHGNSFVSGFGVRCYNDPDEVMLTSVISGFGRRDSIVSLTPKQAMCPGAEVDVAYFNVDDDDFSFSPFDFGCFSNLCPLEMTFVSASLAPPHALSFERRLELGDEGATLDMVLVGAAMTLDGLLDESKFKRFMASMPEMPRTEPPKPLGDLGWQAVGSHEMSVSATPFEDVPPQWSALSGVPALHGLMGIVRRRGPFALQVWIKDGPRRVVGLRSFNASGMFKVRSIYSSYERRTILGGGIDLDIADFSSDGYADLDMGVVSRERPLFLEFDNVTPRGVEAVLNMVLVCIDSSATRDPHVE